MSWGEGMQSKQKPQWAIFKKSHQMNQQQSGKSIGNGCSLSQQNGPGQQQQHLFVTTNKTNTPKQICKRAHLHMEKPPFAADSLMLMPSWRCVGGCSCGCQINIQIQHIKIFFTFYVNCYQFFIYIHKTTERGVEE